MRVSQVSCKERHTSLLTRATFYYIVLGMELTEITNAWGIRLKRLRKRSDLSAAEIAKAAGITPQYFHAIERGEYSPSDDVKLRIANAMNIPVGEIFSYDLEDAS